MKRIAIGFDGMCSDISLCSLTEKHLDEILNRGILPSQLILSLKQDRDEEMTCEGLGITKKEFLEIYKNISEISGITFDIHIGANCALETVTAANLLRSDLAPENETMIDYLGFWSPETLRQVPEKIPQDFLSHARKIKNSEAISLIIPFEGRRSILSFGGDPPIRVLSKELRSYLQSEVANYIMKEKPNLFIIVGTAVTWSSANENDFRLLDKILDNCQRAGTRILCDLGGLGTWSHESLNNYFDVLSKADILSMNESELKIYYRERTGREPLTTSARDLSIMVKEVINEGQGFLVHTPCFQFSYGLDGPIYQSLLFAGKAASYRAQNGEFPSATQVKNSNFRISRKGSREIRDLPKDFHGVAGYSVDDIKNTVGLGDTWTCAFGLSYLGSLS
jgi:hypothetical protein